MATRAINMQNNTDKVEEEKLMDEYLKVNGLYRRKIAKDGSCLFRAVAEQVLHCQALHTKVRAECVKYLRKKREQYESFIEGDFEEYLQRLQDPQSWVGQVEISALSVLYKHDFIIYQNPGEPPANITQNGFYDKVQLCFLNGNHYDSVYPASFSKNAAMCQSILYELLYERVCGVDRSVLTGCVKGSKVKDEAELEESKGSDESDLDEGEDFWSSEANGKTSSVNNRPPYKGRGRGQTRGGGRGFLPRSAQNSLNPAIFRNVEYDVWMRSERAQQRRDFYMAAGMQYTAGDKCKVQLSNTGRFYSAYIEEVRSNEGPVTVFIEELGQRRTVPLWNLRTPSEEAWCTVSEKSKKQSISNGNGQPNEWETRGGRKPVRSVSSPFGSQDTPNMAPSSRVQKQYSWPPQASTEAQSEEKKADSRKLDQDAGGLVVSPAEEEEFLVLERLHKDENNFPTLEASAQAAGEGSRKADRKGSRKKADTETKELSQKPDQKADRGKKNQKISPPVKEKSNSSPSHTPPCEISPASSAPKATKASTPATTTPASAQVAPKSGVSALPVSAGRTSQNAPVLPAVTAAPVKPRTTTPTQPQTAAGPPSAAPSPKSQTTPRAINAVSTNLPSAPSPKPSKTAQMPSGTQTQISKSASVPTSTPVPSPAVTQITAPKPGNAPLSPLTTLTNPAHSQTAPVAKLPHSQAAPIVNLPHSQTAPIVNPAHSLTAPIANPAHSQTAPIVNPAYSQTAPIVNPMHSQTAPIVNPAHSQTAPIVNPAHSQTAPIVNPAHSQTAPIANPAHFQTAPIANPAHFQTAPIVNPMHSQTAPIVNPAHSQTAPIVNPAYSQTAPIANPAYSQTAPIVNPAYSQTVPISNLPHSQTVPISNPAHFQTLAPAHSQTAPVTTPVLSQSTSAANQGPVPTPVPFQPAPETHVTPGHPSGVDSNVPVQTAPRPAELVGASSTPPAPLPVSAHSPHSVTPPAPVSVSAAPALTPFHSVLGSFPFLPHYPSYMPPVPTSAPILTPPPYEPEASPGAGVGPPTAPDYMPHSLPPHPHHLYPVAQLSHLYQDLLYPGFPQNNKDEPVPTPDYSFQRSGKDLPEDTSILRFFFNLGVKAFSHSFLPPITYLAPLTQVYHIQPKAPPPPPPSPSSSQYTPPPSTLHVNSAPNQANAGEHFEVQGGVSGPPPPPSVEVGYGGHPHSLPVQVPTQPGVPWAVAPGFYAGMYPAGQYPTQPCPPAGQAYPSPAGYQQPPVPPPQHHEMNVSMATVAMATVAPATERGEGDGQRSSTPLAEKQTHSAGGQPYFGGGANKPTGVPVAMEPQQGAQAGPMTNQGAETRKDDDAKSYEGGASMGFIAYVQSSPPVDEWELEEAESRDPDLRSGQSYYNRSFKTGGRRGQEDRGGGGGWFRGRSSGPRKDHFLRGRPANQPFYTRGHTRGRGRGYRQGGGEFEPGNTQSF